MTKYLFKQNRLLIGIPLLAIFLVIVVYLVRPDSDGYKLNANQSANLVNDAGSYVDIKNLTGKQLIDIRTVDLYEKGHPGGAINIPVRKMLDAGSIELFDQFVKEKKEVVLYGSDILQVTAPLLLLRQLGYNNLKQLNGGYSDKNDFVQPAISSTEQPHLDTTLIKAPKATIDQIANTPKKVEVVVPRKKETAKGGGC